MRRALLFSVLLLLPRHAQAQVPAVVPTSQVDFTSADHATVIPAGSTFAGQQTISQYQGMIFKVADDPTSGVPVVVGPAVAKTLAVAQPIVPPNTVQHYRLSFSQMGLTGSNGVPACTTLPCPQYTTVLVAIGPNGTTARAVAAESDPFTAPVPVQGPLPASPANLRIIQ